MNTGIPVFVATSLLLWAGAARATEEYPRVIEREVGTAGPPPCSVCHTGDVRGRYTVHTPFGMSLRARGLVASDEGSLRNALQALRLDAADSDGDDRTDIDELVDGTDPNVPEGDAPFPEVQYGCHVGGAGGGATWAGLAAALGLVWQARRRSARRAALGPRI